MALLILLQAENQSNSIAEIIMAIGSVLGILITAASPFLVIWFNKKMNTVTTTMNTNTIITQDTNAKVHEVASKVDGLLDKKTIADEAAGAKKERDIIDKEAAAENVGKLKAHEENKTTVKEVQAIKEVIVKTVETKADETQEVVKEIPKKVVEEVKKIPPK